MKKLVIKLLFVFALGSTALFIYGFVSGFTNVLQPKGEDISKMNIDEVVHNVENIPSTIIALGDSLTKGVGDEEGRGYIGHFHQTLEENYDKKITLSNLAVSGATTEDLLEQLQSEGAKYSVKEADMIVLTIGGNDLFPGIETLASIDLATYETDIDGFRKNAVDIIEQIRAVNSDSPIYWIGLYNPFEDIEALNGTSKFVTQWNYALQEIALTYTNVYMIPTFDLFQGKGTDVLYTDHFHPNKEGYRLIATRLTEKVISQVRTDVGQ